MYVGEALWTVKLGLTEFGNQAKPLKYSEKQVVFRSYLDQMLKLTVNDLDIQPTTQPAQTNVRGQTCQFAAVSRIRAIRFSSESSDDV